MCVLGERGEGICFQQTFTILNIISPQSPVEHIAWFKKIKVSESQITSDKVNYVLLNSYFRNIFFPKMGITPKTNSWCCQIHYLTRAVLHGRCWLWAGDPWTDYVLNKSRTDIRVCSVLSSQSLKGPCWVYGQTDVNGCALFTSNRSLLG